MSVDDARRIVADYVTHYNTTRLHSAIGYVTPQDMLDGKDRDIHQERDRKLAQARERRRLMRQQEHRPATPTPASPPTPSTPPPAIDFAAVRAAISMAQVLQLLGFQAKTSRGPQQRGACPLHGSSSDASRCFSAHLDRQIFHCFRCGRSGNALDLWAAATRQPPYHAALDLCHRLNIPLPMLPTQHREEEPVAATLPSYTMPSPEYSVPFHELTPQGDSSSSR